MYDSAYLVEGWSSTQLNSAVCRNNMVANSPLSMVLWFGNHGLLNQSPVSNLA